MAQQIAYCLVNRPGTPELSIENYLDAGTRHRRMRNIQQTFSTGYRVDINLAAGGTRLDDQLPGIF